MKEALKLDQIKSAADILFNLVGLEYEKKIYSNTRRKQSKSYSLRQDNLTQNKLLVGPISLKEEMELEKEQEELDKFLKIMDLTAQIKKLIPCFYFF